ncbi:C2H2-type zinc finger protein [Magnetospirillum sp. 64-120]|uniref:C2H2-type zinc finger protein n=1 Tax=Magnetospirillum sp. 64-120 TaxID=1895778 RepID=UPI000926C631|nr:C2H2-type zinc finger protein [Magnetospirillum sp. 64-120]OJX68454.1 MAG: hypothetical protein BGO92_18670 [Magnetospirillum sp. 64-120]
MSFIVSQELLNEFWEAMNEPASPPKMARAHLSAGQIIANGWADPDEIEDLVWALDWRLRRFGARHLLELFQIPKRFVFRQPARKSDEVWGTERISAADVTQLLIMLERLGFHADPSVMACILGQAVASLPMLTEAEYAIHCFERLRHKMPPVFLAVEKPRLWEAHEQRHQTVTGYKAIFSLDKSGNACLLEVRAPKFRKRPEPQLETCSICGLSYLRGSAADEALHRKEHRLWMSVLEPKPDRMFLQRLSSNADPEHVTARSGKWLQQHMYQRARHFKREFHYDFVQWAPSGEEPHAHGFLFNDDTGTFGNGAIVGACAFRWREDHWGLQFIWITPKARRKGILTRRWQRFREQFGEFEIEPPLSAAMKRFAARNASPAQLPYGPSDTDGPDQEAASDVTPEHQ